MTETLDESSPTQAKRAKFANNFSPEANQLCEKDVGIIEYVLPKQTGFKGTLKGRWEDFLVREVDTSGKVCRLLSLAPLDVSNGVASAVEPVDKYVIPIEIDEVLKEIDRETMFEASFPASDDKIERENFHKAIRLNYPSLVSKTTDVDNNRFVVVTRGVLVKGKKAWERTSRTYDPPKNAPFCHFVLYKEGKDTMQALHVIGRMLKINANAFSYAGTKDRRAITTQNVCIKNIPSRRLASLNPRLNGIKVGNFSYSTDSLVLGELQGNRFSIAIRDVTSADAEIHKAIMQWQKHGFINYYGLQRFGHCAEARTFEIGREIIKCNWEKAIDLILVPTGSDLPIVRKIKETYQETQDAKACGENMPQCLEKTILLGIARHGKTVTAIQKLPRNMRQLYAHSYQSLVWNRVASRRVREFGIGADGKATIGDLYFPPGPLISKGLRSVNSSSELCFDDAMKEFSQPEELHPPKPPVTPSAPSRVTKDGERPLISQVVLPLPGYDILFPDNDLVSILTLFVRDHGFGSKVRPTKSARLTGVCLKSSDLKAVSLRIQLLHHPDGNQPECPVWQWRRHLYYSCEKWYHEIFAEDSLKLEAFKHKVKDFALPGSYRHLIVKPEDVHYEIREYSDPLKPLVQSDFVAMTAALPSRLKHGSAEEKEDASEDGELHRALILEFTLPKAAYATMAIRELMKDVSVAQ